MQAVGQQQGAPGAAAAAAAAAAEAGAEAAVTQEARFRAVFNAHLQRLLTATPPVEKTAAVAQALVAAKEEMARETAATKERGEEGEGDGGKEGEGQGQQQQQQQQQEEEMETETEEERARKAAAEAEQREAQRKIDLAAEKEAQLRVRRAERRRRRHEALLQREEAARALTEDIFPTGEGAATSICTLPEGVGGVEEGYGLTVDAFRERLQAAEESNDFSQVSRLLGRVFSESKKLNWAFVKPIALPQALAGDTGEAAMEQEESKAAAGEEGATTTTRTTETTEAADAAAAATTPQPMAEEEQQQGKPAETGENAEPDKTAAAAATGAQGGEQTADEKVEEKAKEEEEEEEVGKQGDEKEEEEENGLVLDAEHWREFLPDIPVDVNQTEEFYSLVVGCENDVVRNAIFYSLLQLTDGLKNRTARAVRSVRELTQFVIILENPLLLDPSYEEIARSLLLAIHALPPVCRATLSQWFEQCDRDRLTRYVQTIHQFISFRLLGAENLEDARKGMQVLKLLADSEDAVERRTGARRVKLSEFYNDALNEEHFRSREGRIHEYRLWMRDVRRNHIAMSDEPPEEEEEDELGQRPPRPTRDEDFFYEPESVLSHPFVLTPASKGRALSMDATVQMNHEIEATRREAMMRGGLMGMLQFNPYLILRVHRQNIVQDSLHQVVFFNDTDLKKPLKVHFEGEEGIDEGGVRKEYFQVMTRELLTPDFGMFIRNDETNTLWFNCDSYEDDQTFELVGILLGIAIYNSVIIDVSFPMVVYKKLMGHKPTLDDLSEAQPALAHGLQQLLDYTGDVADIGQPFQLSYEVFGELRTVDLKEGGGDMVVTNENKQEYVDLYVSWVLEKSVERQFGAFNRGFHKVCGGRALALFKPEELELLVCGDKVLDFEALERVTHYEDGYTEDSPVIRNFWTVIRGFSDEEKRLFLKFVSGSDRAPIDGLSSMVFVISKNGEHSDRLPTAHTCFNHLLLPAYESLEAMRERLTIAISQSEGFGLK